jgi:hypothetical protein
MKVYLDDMVPVSMLPNIEILPARVYSDAEGSRGPMTQRVIPLGDNDKRIPGLGNEAGYHPILPAGN